MKFLIAITVVVALQGMAVACKTGEIEVGGNCAAMPSPEDQALAPLIPTSTEQPSRHPESAWERGEVHAEMPLPETADSEKDKMVAYEAKAEKDQR